MMFQFLNQQPVKLDPIDDQILLGIQEGKTLQDLGAALGRSFAGIRKRMKALEQEGYIIYNPGKARARMLTSNGTEYLKANGLLKTEVFR